MIARLIYIYIHDSLYFYTDLTESNSTNSLFLTLIHKETNFSNQLSFPSLRLNSATD